MSKALFFGMSARRAVTATRRGVAVCLGLLAFSAHAAQTTSAPFSVSVNLSGSGSPPPVATPTPADSGSCTLYSVFATSVKVSCFPGAVSFFAVPSWMEVSRIAVGEPVDGPVAGRTATSWRWVTLENLKYLEMMVRW